MPVLLSQVDVSYVWHIEWFWFQFFQSDIRIIDMPYLWDNIIKCNIALNHSIVLSKFLCVIDFGFTPVLHIPGWRHIYVAYLMILICD